MSQGTMGSMATGAVAGLLAGAAIGAVGMYAVSGNSTQMKKTIKKAEKGAEKAIENVEKFLNR